MPNFFLVGAAKAGTTALHSFLAAHSEIYMSPIKESNFFSQPDMKKELFIRNYRNSINFNLKGYLRGPMTKMIHIANIQTWDDYIQLFRNVRDEVAIGEASNSYLLCPCTANQIAKRVPKAKILIMLRNPIERAWSHYLMNRRLGYTLKKHFIEEFSHDTKQYPRGWGITHNYLELGMYSSQLKRYYSYFPSDQIKIMLYDDFQESPEHTLKDIFSFLAVDTTQIVTLGDMKNRAALPRFQILNYLLFQSGTAAKLKRIFPSAIVSVAEKLLFTNSSLPKLDPTERVFLRDIYMDEIYSLSDILGRDLTHWLEM
jgi:hypothetical protein